MLGNMETVGSPSTSTKKDVSSTEIFKTPKSGIFNEARAVIVAGSAKKDSIKVLDMTKNDDGDNITIRKRKRRVSDYVFKANNQPETISTPLKLFTPDPEIEDLVSCVKAGNECSPKLRKQLIEQEKEHTTATQPHKRRRLSMPIQSLHSSNFDPLNLFSESPQVTNKFAQNKTTRKRRSLMLPQKCKKNVSKQKITTASRPAWNYNNQKLFNGHGNQDKLKLSKISTVSKKQSVVHNGVRQTPKKPSLVTAKKPSKEPSTSLINIRKKLQNNSQISNRNSSISQKVPVKCKNVVQPHNEVEDKPKLPSSGQYNHDEFDKPLKLSQENESEVVGVIKTTDNIDKVTADFDNIPDETLSGHHSKLTNEPICMNGYMAELPEDQHNMHADVSSNKVNQISKSSNKMKCLSVTCVDINKLPPEHTPAKNCEHDVNIRKTQLDAQKTSCEDTASITSRIFREQKMISNTNSEQNSDKETIILSTLCNDSTTSDNLSHPCPSSPSIVKEENRTHMNHTAESAEEYFSSPEYISAVSKLGNEVKIDPSVETKILHPKKLNFEQNCDVSGNSPRNHDSSLYIDSHKCTIYSTKNEIRLDANFENSELNFVEESNECESVVLISSDANDNIDKIEEDNVTFSVVVEEEATSPKEETSECDNCETQTNTRKTRSKTKIRRNLPKLQVRHTPMGLPKPLREKKEKFSIEEIYLNKNFKTPTEKKWETIFEFPKENKDGTISNCEKRKKRRLCDFTTDPSQRKKRWKKNKVKISKRKLTSQNLDTDKILAQKLFNLDHALQLADLSP